MENGRRHQTGLRRLPHLLLFRWVWVWVWVWGAYCYLRRARCAARLLVVCDAMQPCGNEGGKSHSVPHCRRPVHASSSLHACMLQMLVMGPSGGLLLRLIWVVNELGGDNRLLCSFKMSNNLHCFNEKSNKSDLNALCNCQ